MVLQRMIVHPRGLSLAMRRKVWVLRRDRTGGRPTPWKEIAKQVTNLQGEHPYWKVVRDAYNQLQQPPTRSSDAYANCGRPQLLTTQVKKAMVKHMCKLRKTSEVTSGDLVRWLARAAVKEPGTL